jgi:hypothetical protein
LTFRKKIWLHLQCLWRRGILPTSKINASKFQKNGRFSISSEKKQNLLVGLGNRKVSNLPAEAPVLLVGEPSHAVVLYGGT